MWREEGADVMISSLEPGAGDKSSRQLRLDCLAHCHEGLAHRLLLLFPLWRWHCFITVHACSRQSLVIGVCITIRDGHADAAMSDSCRLMRLFWPEFHLLCSQSSQIWVGEKWGFFYYLMRLIATWGASCRHDSALRKTGAWPSLITMPKRKQKGLMKVI